MESTADRAMIELHRFKARADREIVTLDERNTMIRWAHREGARPKDIAEALGTSRAAVRAVLDTG